MGIPGRRDLGRLAAPYLRDRKQSPRRMPSKQTGQMTSAAASGRWLGLIA
jgi:hypothetical protein